MDIIIEQLERTRNETLRYFSLEPGDLENNERHLEQIRRALASSAP